MHSYLLFTLRGLSPKTSHATSSLGWIQLYVQILHMLKCSCTINQPVTFPCTQVDWKPLPILSESLHFIAIPSTIHHVSTVSETQPGEHSMKEDLIILSSSVVAITFGWEGCRSHYAVMAFPEYLLCRTHTRKFVTTSNNLLLNRFHQG